MLLRIAMFCGMFCLPLTANAIVQSDDDFQVESGFTRLFNGTDLTGWRILPTTEQQKKQRANWQRNPQAPPWPIYTEAIDFDGQKKSEDGRFRVENGTLVVTVPPEGRKIQMLYTKREFPKDFVLKLEFRAAENADSGVFIRGKQLQCRDYPNAGPYKQLKKFKPGDWNELVVVVKGNSAHCTCNGEVLEENFELPDTGPIGVEGDRGRMEYRRIRFSESEVLANNGQLKPTNKASSWTFELTGDGKGTVKEDGDAITFETTEVGSENWHVQAYQTGLALAEGAKYIVRFEIKSPTSSSVLLMGLINQPDWHEIGLHEEVDGGQSFSQQEFEFTATDVAKGPNNRIGFVMGESKGIVSIRNMTLTRK